MSPTTRRAAPGEGTAPEERTTIEQIQASVTRTAVGVNEPPAQDLLDEGRDSGDAR